MLRGNVMMAANTGAAINTKSASAFSLSLDNNLANSVSANKLGDSIIFLTTFDSLAHLTATNGLFDFAAIRSHCLSYANTVPI